MAIIRSDTLTLQVSSGEQRAVGGHACGKYRVAHLMRREGLRSQTGYRQYVAICYTERLADAGIKPSVGSVSDSCGNALAETVIGLCKTEVIDNAGHGST